MVEVELKFQIPEARRSALLKALDPKKSEIIHLQAKYFDTPDRKLAQQHIAIRQRLEGTRWIQTLKAAGKSHIQRFEHNIDLGELDAPPELDLSVYQTAPEAQAILTHALGANFDQLQLQFETVVERTSRLVSHLDAEIEISLDRGLVKTLSSEQEIHEVEFELKSGSIQSLLNFCFEWVKKYQLWLDVRSKAEIGNLLAIGQKVSPAVGSKEFLSSKKDHADKNLRKLIAQQLQHLLPNIAAISAGVAESEHFDQAELALEQLYLSTSLFKDWSSDVSEKWSYQLQAFKQQFENLKHYEHMKETLGGFLQNKNTAMQLEKDILYAREKLNNLVKSTLNVHHFLELMTFSLDDQSSSTALDLKTAAQTSLQQQYKQLQESFSQIDQHDFDQLNDLAHKIQALKFSFPILTHIHDIKNLQKYSKALNDAHFAAKEYLQLSQSTTYIQQTELEASDWFVLGWLTAKQEVFAEKFLEQTEQFLVSRKFVK